MSKSIVASVADFTKQIADSVAIGDTTFTLNSLTDSDGVALADAKLYGFTIDTGAKKEYVVALLSSGTFTGVKSISRQGAVTTGFTKEHRIGVSAQITDHAALYRVVATLLGVNDLDAGVALKYDGAPTQTAPNALATVQFVLDTANGGAVSFNATTIAGVVGEDVTDGDWVYFKESDGKWYLTDADDTAKSVNVKIGKVRATTTSGNSVAGGIFVDGQETVATYVAGTTYYLSNTAGELATSAGTNYVVVGVGSDEGNLFVVQPAVHASTTVAGVVEEATLAEVLAGTAAGATGARLFVNPSTQKAPIINIYTANDTWTKPTGASNVKVILIGGGSGGSRSFNGSTTSAGAGGGGGGYASELFPASILGATETITVGAGGAGASAEGTGGDAGGNSSFGSWLIARGGAAGPSGGVLPGAAGGNGESTGSIGGASSGADGTAAIGGGAGGGGGRSLSAGVGGIGGAASRFGAAGGGGGGSSVNIGAVGGAQSYRGTTINGGTAGTTSGGAGGAASDVTANEPTPGAGGGGGGGNSGGVGGVGGAGGKYGGGGGGGGGGSGNSGNGGAGAAGIVMVITYV